MPENTKIVTVNSDIYINGEPRGFGATGYRYSLRHPLIAHLYRQYKDWRKLPPSMPISDKHRREFEAHIDKMIDEGKIVVGK